MRFEDLEVWKKSAKLSAELYKTLSNLKDYGFRDQITRSGLSIPSNIAEGFERDSIKECLNFLSYARGSCGELRAQVFIGIEAGFIQEQNGTVWIKETKEISAMLTALMNARKSFLGKK